MDRERELKTHLNSVVLIDLTRNCLIPRRGATDKDLSSWQHCLQVFSLGDGESQEVLQPRGRALDRSRTMQRDFELMKKQVGPCFELSAQVAASYGPFEAQFPNGRAASFTSLSSSNRNCGSVLRLEMG